MITNKEIISNQLKRINEKMHTSFTAKQAKDGTWFLCNEKNGCDTPPFPLNNDWAHRTEEQMIEYLAGVEDAVDFYTHCGTATPK